MLEFFKMSQKPLSLMIQGCTSDAGKSTVAAALCRILARRGIAVAPFKPQNMALNSAVTVEGGEIGRAQAVQARAARVAPSVHMNPILLKPSSDTGAQVIVQGFARETMQAGAYHNYKAAAMPYVLDSWQKLQQQYRFIVVEGAGSPAEINLRDRDIANMGFAEAVDCPVILVADIDRGGVFAHLVGTLDLLSPSEQNRVIGFVINRFRGDIKLLEPGLRWLEERTGKKVWGVLPYLHNLHLEAEDAIARDKPQKSERRLKVVVPVLPRISNHTDFDVLRLHPQVELQFVSVLEKAIPPADLVILPGSKAVRADLAELLRNGWSRYLMQHLRYGGKVMGVCGGLQMLGRMIHDPQGIEGAPGSCPGFGLLDFETTLYPEKVLKCVSGHLAQGSAKVTGYEIHCGLSSGPALQHPALWLDNEANERRADGALSADGQILATYLHGLFDHPEAMISLLAWAGVSDAATFDYEALQESEIDRLADMVEKEVDVEVLLERVEAFHSQ